MSLFGTFSNRKRIGQFRGFRQLSQIPDISKWRIQGRHQIVQQERRQCFVISLSTVILTSWRQNTLEGNEKF